MEISHGLDVIQSFEDIELQTELATDLLHRLQSKLAGVLESVLLGLLLFPPDLNLPYLGFQDLKGL